MVHKVMMTVSKSVRHYSLGIWQNHQRQNLTIEQQN